MRNLKMFSYHPHIMGVSIKKVDENTYLPHYVAIYTNNHHSFIMLKDGISHAYDPYFSEHYREELPSLIEESNSIYAIAGYMLSLLAYDSLPVDILSDAKLKVEQYPEWFNEDISTRIIEMIDRRTPSYPASLENEGKFRYVYLMWCSNGLRKIGISSNPYRRIHEIRKHVFEQIEIEYLIRMPHENARKLESFLHNIFSHKHVRNEWFRLSNEDVETIKNFEVINER